MLQEENKTGLRSRRKPASLSDYSAIRVIDEGE
jgi:hypothetical protein